MEYLKSSFLIIICFILQNSAVAQSKTNKNDSTVVIEYSAKFSLPEFSNTSITRLIIDSDVSYYFISTPSYLIEDQLQPNASIIKYKDSNYLLFNRPMLPKYGKNTYWRDSLTPMKWVITNRRDSINGRMLNEATTNFRGRFFTAYYDPAIPISDGPLKFNGLPGLIVKLFDSDRLWDFSLKSITKSPKKYIANSIEIAGDFNLFKAIYPEWDRKIKEKSNANKSVDPNCVGCKTKVPKTYSIEKDLEYN